MDFDLVIAPALILLAALLISALSLYRIRTLRYKGYPKWRRIFEQSVLPLAVLVAVAVAVGFGATFNAFATHHYRSIYVAPGSFYLIDGYEMHLYCTGAGTPTIVLDSGLGDDSLIWTKVQPELSKTTRVCSYDRAGFGWSDPQPGPHDADQIAQQLHGLLNAGGIVGPIVLMGHSIAGLYIRDYAARYPKDLSGLIFVDASTPFQDDRFPAEIREEEKKAVLESLRLKWLEIFGIIRLSGRCAQSGGPEGREGKMMAENQCRASQLTAMAHEQQSVKQSGDETIRTGSFGDLPILIFSQDSQPTGSSEFPQEVQGAFSKTWNEMQEDLKHLSSRSRRIIAKGSSHYIQIDRAELLNSEVANFVERVRGKAPEPHYSSTITE